MWDSIMNTVEDGEDEVFRLRESQRFTVVK
jgi:hypothetical protein